MKKAVLSLVLLVIGFTGLFAEIRGEKMFVGDTPRMVYYDTEDYRADKYDYSWIEFAKSYNAPRICWEGYTYKYDDTINMGRVPINTDVPLDARFAKYKYIMIDREDNNTVIEWFYTEDNEVVLRRWFYKTK